MRSDRDQKAKKRLQMLQMATLKGLAKEPAAYTLGGVHPQWISLCGTWLFTRKEEGRSSKESLKRKVEFHHTPSPPITVRSGLSKLYKSCFLNFVGTKFWGDAALRSDRHKHVVSNLRFWKRGWDKICTWLHPEDQLKLV